MNTKAPQSRYRLPVPLAGSIFSVIRSEGN